MHLWHTPVQDISEITNPAGDDVDQEQLDGLNNVRNSLLVYKLLHYYDKIPNIKINLKNREKQLFKPLLRVFQDSKIFDTILKTVSVFVGEKRQARSHTLTAFLCELVSDLQVTQHGATLDSSVIWQGFIDALPGGEKIGKFTYKSEEFDEKSQKEITEMLKDQFGTTRPKHKGKKKQLVFDISKLKSMRDKYNLNVDVKVISEFGSESDESDESDESLVGLDRHLSRGT